MDEEIGASGGTGWRKAIPEGRDRVQSQGLVWVVGGMLVWACAETLRYAWPLRIGLGATILGSAAISIAFAVLVLALRAATTAGALFGAMICFILTLASRGNSVLRSGLAPLIALFLLTFLATRAGRRVKAAAGLAEHRRGRSASQIIANLAAAALSIASFGVFMALSGPTPCCGVRDSWSWVLPQTMVMSLAALVEATADTVSSEIGQAIGGRPVMVLSLRRVAVGTDGAVTLLGTLAGVLGGTLVTAVGIWAFRLSFGQAGIALGAGVAGLFFDSLLGATVERKGWLGNDLVNFASTVFAAGVALGLLWVMQAVLATTYHKG